MKKRIKGSHRVVTIIKEIGDQSFCKVEGTFYKWVPSCELRPVIKSKYKFMRPVIDGDVLETVFTFLLSDRIQAKMTKWVVVIFTGWLISLFLRMIFQ